MEVIAIKTPIISERKYVKAFLIELMEVLQSKDFDIDDDLLIIKSQKEEVRFSTRYTLLDLEYDSHDVVERLKELTIADYSELWLIKM